MAPTHLFAGVPTADLAPALAWYERLMGRPPDMTPNESEAVWHLGESGSIYVVADAGRAGRALVTIMGDDLEEHVAGLAERGLATGAIETLASGARKAVIADPDGNTIAFGDVGR